MRSPTVAGPRIGESWLGCCPEPERLSAGSHCARTKRRRQLATRIPRFPIFLVFNIESNPLRERKLRPEIDRVGGATHVRLPRIGASLTAAAGLLFAPK